MKFIIIVCIILLIIMCIVLCKERYRYKQHFSDYVFILYRRVLIADTLIDDICYSVSFSKLVFVSIRYLISLSFLNITYACRFRKMEIIRIYNILNVI